MNVDITTTDELKNWLANAAPGRSATYHYGSLDIDRQRPDQIELDKLATLALKLADEAHVDLAQKRNGTEGCFFYVIQRRTEPKRRRPAPEPQSRGRVQHSVRSSWPENPTA
jgi:hypothetical protein